jgi:hypothetical protein
MRALFKRTVRMSVTLGLADMALADGTKVVANAAKDRSLDAEGLAKLLERTEEEFRKLEAQNEGGDEQALVRLPRELAARETLKKQVLAAMVSAEGGRVNLTDGDAKLMKGRHGIVVGYNLACHEQDISVVMPQAHKQELKGAYHKFVYGPYADSYHCPMGNSLRFVGVKERTGGLQAVVLCQSPSILRQAPCGCT